MSTSLFNWKRILTPLAFALALVAASAINAPAQDEPLKIIKKDPVREVGRNCRVPGGNIFVVTNVEFLDTGKVGSVNVFRSSGCGYFDTEAIRVSRRINFKPQIKAGKPVTTTRKVEYHVRVY